MIHPLRKTQKLEWKIPISNQNCPVCMFIPFKQKLSQTQLHFFSSCGHVPICASLSPSVLKALLVNSQPNYGTFTASCTSSSIGGATVFSSVDVLSSIVFRSPDSIGRVHCFASNISPSRRRGWAVCAGNCYVDDFLIYTNLSFSFLLFDIIYNSFFNWDQMTYNIVERL